MPKRFSANSTIALKSASILVFMTVACETGCIPADMSDRFRTAATDSVMSGLKTIATGMIDGLFAMWEPSESSGTDGE